MKAIRALLLPLALAGCVTAGAAGNSTADRTQSQAMESFLRCLYTNARKLDDRVTDPQTIALAMQSACETVYLDTSEAFDEYNEPANRRRFNAMFDSWAVRQSTRIVLEIRGER